MSLEELVVLCLADRAQQCGRGHLQRRPPPRHRHAGFHVSFAYGAAGPMMLPSMLDLVPLRRVVVPPHPGLFSALGLLSSDQVFTEERGVSCRLEAVGWPPWRLRYRQWRQIWRRACRRPLAEVHVRAQLRRSLQGQGFETPFVRRTLVDRGGERAETVRAAFHDAYEARNANRFEHLPVEVLWLFGSTPCCRSQGGVSEAGGPSGGGRSEGELFSCATSTASRFTLSSCNAARLLAGDCDRGSGSHPGGDVDDVRAGRAAGGGRPVWASWSSHERRFRRHP